MQGESPVENIIEFGFKDPSVGFTHVHTILMFN